MHNSEDFPIEEVWGTYHAIARTIKPRLIAFKNLDKHGYPLDHDNMESWNSTIQKMIDAFESLSKNRTDFVPKENNMIELGLDLFRKYYRNLWD